VSQQAHRIYLRTWLPFLITLSVSCLAVLTAIAFFDTGDNSRFALILLAVVLFTMAYFLDKASLSWIEISEDGKEVVSVPSWYGRKLCGARRVVKQIIPGSELLFCRIMAYGALDGYYVILRTPDISDLVLWSTDSGISRRVWARVVEDLRTKRQLNARMVKLAVGDQGKVETDWTGQADRMQWKNMRLAIAPALFPWLGIVAGALISEPWKIALVGLLFWVSGFSMFWYFYRGNKAAKGQTLGSLTFVWTIQFAGLYAVAVLITRAFLHR
jgi:hypothetical protein